LEYQLTCHNLPLATFLANGTSMKQQQSGVTEEREGMKKTQKEGLDR
jgi:hypothetical protein